jgi:ankyrin repeat protein
MDLNKKDGKGSTPLHWAAYLASENAVNFLSSWEEIDINA